MSIVLNSVKIIIKDTRKTSCFEVCFSCFVKMGKVDLHRKWLSSLEKKRELYLGSMYHRTQVSPVVASVIWDLDIRLFVGPVFS